MPLFFLLIALGLLTAALCNAALAWDGSVYLFRILQDGAPFTPWGRLGVVPIQAPVVLAVRVLRNQTVVQGLFGLLYAAVPFGALFAAWRIVRRGAPRLFVWPALGIGLATLPGQLFFVAEANIAVQAFWPVFLAALSRRDRPALLLVLIGGPLLVLLHPMALLLLAAGAGLAFAAGIFARAERRRLWGRAGIFLGFLAVGAALPRSGYESDGLSPPTLLPSLAAAFDQAVRGWPLAALALVFLAALLHALRPHLAERRPGLAVPALIAVSLAAAGLCLTIWAADPRLWKAALSFRFWSGIVTVPLLALTTLDAVRPAPEPAAGVEACRAGWLAIVWASGAVFCLVLVVQSIGWVGLTGRLEETLAAESQACIPLSTVGWLPDTALGHWSTPYYAIILQGPAPNTLLLPEDQCAVFARSGQVELEALGASGAKGIWFNFSRAEAKRGAAAG